MSLTLLPDDLTTHVLTFLEKKDFLQYQLVCRTLRTALLQEQLWKVLCIRDGYNVHANVPRESFRNFYMDFEPRIGKGEMMWFVKYDSLEGKWILNNDAVRVLKGIEGSPTAILTMIDPDDTKNGTKLFSSLLGLESGCEMDEEMDPGLYMWGKPSILRRTSRFNMVYMKTHGFNDEFFSHDQRKILMKLILLISSTTMIVADLTEKLLSDLSRVSERVKHPPLFGAYDHMRSMLFVKPVPDKTVQIFDIFDQIGKLKYVRDGIDHRDVGFLSLMLNWFGKCHGVQLDPNIVSREDLYAFVGDMTKPLTFGWPLSQWGPMKPTGSLISQFAKTCIQEINQIDLCTNEKILGKFSEGCLYNEMVKSITFYTKATSSEIDPSKPLEMRELVAVSEQHSQSALRIFTQSIHDALYRHEVVGEMESNLKNGINSNVRNIWLRNSKISETFCATIFDSCFKWIKVLLEIPDDEMTSEILKKRFLESIDVYIQNAKGPRKLQVLSFYTQEYIELLESIYPEYKSPALVDIAKLVERRAVYETEILDQERKKLQKKSAYGLKLQTIENTIFRLTEEIAQRKQQTFQSDQFDCQRDENMIKCGFNLSYEKKEMRKRFIESLEENLKHEIAQFQEFEIQLKNLQ